MNVERFLSRIEKGPSNACWPWTRSRHQFGYGAFWDGKKVRNAHVLAWELANGEPIGKRHVLHSCDNPPCCNPAHLRAGTAKDNAADARQRKGCFQRNRATGHPHTKWTQVQLDVLLLYYDALPRRSDGNAIKGTLKPLLRRHGITEGSLRYALKLRERKLQKHKE